MWVAVALYAVAHADPTTGIARMSAGELRAAVAPDAAPSVISQAIRRAVKAGWLHPDSTAWGLRLARPVGGAPVQGVGGAPIEGVGGGRYA